MANITVILPMQRDWPRPTCVVWCTASYVRVPDLDTMPVKTAVKDVRMVYEEGGEVDIAPA